MDDFIGSIAQEDVDFITEIVKTARIGDNYKHLVIYTDSDQLNTSATFNLYKDGEDTLFSMIEVTKDNYADYAKATLLVWLRDYFTAGGQESVFLINVDGTASGVAETYSDDPSRLDVAFNKTKQIGYFKSICIADPNEDDGFALLPSAALKLATLCEEDKLLSAAPLLPYAKEVTTVLDDPVYLALKTAGKGGFFSYAKTETNAAIVSLALALGALNDSGTYAGNSFDMVKTDALTIENIYGEPLSPSVQNVLKAGNVQYWKPVGDSTGNIAARGASTSKGDIVPALWIVAFCNYYNKCQVASYITRRNVFKDATTYNVLLSILSTTVSKFVQTGRVTNFMLTAPAFSALPQSDDDTIVVDNAWQGYYVDDLRTVKIYGSLTI